MEALRSTARRPEFRILGPLEVLAGDDRLRLAGSRQRNLLAALLLDAGQVVAWSQLVDLMWEQAPPATAKRQVQNCVGALRRQLSRCSASVDVLVADGPGCRLQVDHGQLDALVFREKVAEARSRAATGQAAESVVRFRSALGLWRGPALAGITNPTIRGRAARLDEQHLGVLEDCIDLELVLGRHRDVVGELYELVTTYTSHEGFAAQLMLALHRGGRKSEALQVYQRLRRRLTTELGIDPSPRLRRLEVAILRDDPALDVPAARIGFTVGGSGHGPPEPLPAQLPADVPDFTGRELELSTLDSFVPDEGNDQAAAVRIAAIVGVPGVGKTALAVHWAHRIRHRFPSGQLYINLRGYGSGEPLRPIDALAQFIRALGVAADKVPPALGEAASLYRTLLADRRLLVVLDNAADVEQVRPLLPAAAGCLVLITSRDRLTGLVANEGARSVRLAALEPDKAVRLLARIVGEAAVLAERAAAAELARLCGYLPLSLRIAAANVVCQPEQTVARFVAELDRDDYLTRLETGGDGQSAVLTSFDLSYQRLDPESRRLFRLLGLVPGPEFTPAAAAALAGISERTAALVLDRLSAAHLVHEHPRGRFSLHDLLGLYARHLVATSDTEQERAMATARLFDFYLSTSDAAARLCYPQAARLPTGGSARTPVPVLADSVAALAWLDAERANLVAAVQHAARHGSRHVAWLLADTLRGYFHLRRHMIDWLMVGNAGLGAAQLEGDLHGQTAARLGLAQAHFSLARYPEAVEHYTAALTLSGQAGWTEAEATALGHLGAVYRELGRLPEAADCQTRALALNRRLGRPISEAYSLSRLGNVYWHWGRLRQAAEFHARALALNREIGHRSGEATDLVNLGNMHRELGMLSSALEELGQGLAMHRELGSRHSEAAALGYLAAAHRDAGHDAQALEHANAALVIAREIGDRLVECMALTNLATTHERLGEHALAIKHHNAALRLARQTGAPYRHADALLGLAAANLGLDHPDMAIARADEALSLSRRDGFGVLEGRAHATLAAAYLAADQPGSASRHGRQALDLRRRTGYLPSEPPGLPVLARLADRSLRSARHRPRLAGTWRVNGENTGTVGGNKPR